MEKEFKMVTWFGTLVVLLNKLWKTRFKAIREIYSVKDQIKRIGVYYMCLDDLPL